MIEKEERVLMVSYDAGSHYCPDGCKPEDIPRRCTELDAEGMRWYVEGDDLLVSARHRDILAFMSRLNARPEKPKGRQSHD
jgi:hypothetical protein